MSLINSGIKLFGFYLSGHFLLSSDLFLDNFLIVFDDLDNIYNKTIPKTLALDNHFISGYFNKLPKICILMITYFEILYFHCLANGYFKCDPD